MQINGSVFAVRELFRILNLLAVKNAIPFFLIITIIAITSCKKDINHLDDSFNCSLLKEGIVNRNDSIVKYEINKLTFDLYPKPTDSDESGHLINFDTLINRINICIGIDAEMFCYACIKTGPPQSLVLITTDSAGIQIQRKLDFLTSENSVLKFLGIEPDN